MANDREENYAGPLPSGSFKKFLFQASQWRWSALVLAAALWLPSAHFLFRAEPRELMGDGGVSVHAQKLAKRQMLTWTEAKQQAQEIERMRRSNAEWDFMGRSFFVWSLGEMALRDPQGRKAYVAIMDRVIDATLRLEESEGMHHFLMPYSRRGEFLQRPARSQFIDGEIALMLGVRRLVEERSDYKELLQNRVRLMATRMERSPVFSCESYPDECWTFCNTISLAAIKLSDRLDGSDHSALLRNWVRVAKEKLTDPGTGLLVSSYAWNGRHKDGPEGSSIWMAAHCLRIVDAEFAADQYRRARKEMGRNWLGFGFAREWPASWRGPVDVDSGPVVPIVGASPGASGLALVAASSFHDDGYRDALHTTLNFAAFPVREREQIRYCASNQLGDAVMLYAAVLGPVWEIIQKGK